MELQRKYSLLLSCGDRYSFLRSTLTQLHNFGLINSWPFSSKYCVNRKASAIQIIPITGEPPSDPPLSVPLLLAESVQGTQGRLLCNVTPPIEGDRVILVIWYKDGLSTPIYR